MIGSLILKEWRDSLGSFVILAAIQLPLTWLFFHTIANFMLYPM